MRGVVDFGQMLKIQVGIDLSGSDMRMSEHLLNRAQITAGLQQVRGKRMPQNVRMHILLDTLLLGSLFQAVADGARTDRTAAL